MARDFKDKILALSVLDICPTLDMYELTDMKFAKGYFHWFYLIQPAPLPEKMIMADPKRWLKSRFNRSSKRAIGKVEDEYFRAFKQKKRIHATCEDYRAAATIDLENDNKDRKKKLKLTNKYSDQITQLLRYKNDSILISSKTLNKDNPRLDCRINGLSKFSPTRVILDRCLSIKKNSHIYLTSVNKNTVIFYNVGKQEKINLLKKKGIKLVKIFKRSLCINK